MDDVDLGKEERKDLPAAMVESQVKGAREAEGAGEGLARALLCKETMSNIVRFNCF